MAVNRCKGYKANLARATRSIRLRDGRVEEDRVLRLVPAEPAAV